jgi:hypothetical protein
VLEWLGAHRGVIAHEESRILHAGERFVAEVERFKGLSASRADALDGLRSAIASFAAKGADPAVRLIVEKEPLEPIAIPDRQYGEWLRRVREILPEMKILFMVRDPVATVSSMRARNWGHSLTVGVPRSFSLEECIAVWRANALLAIALTEDASVMRCSYDHLVADPRGVSSRVGDFLRLDLRPFQPRDARPSVLSAAEVALVLEKTGHERALLNGAAGGL